MWKEVSGKRILLLDVDEMKREYLKLANDQSLLYLYPKSNI